MPGLRLLVSTALAVSCGGSDAPPVNHVEDPQPSPGAGVGGGSVLGELNVFVVDETSGNALAGATVRVEIADAEPLVEIADADGFVRFEDGALEGPQVVTAIAEDHAASTWYGVDGAVVTIPLESVEPEDAALEAPPTAMLYGTILGWEDLPDPEPNFALAALITFSRKGPGDDLIMQDPHPILSSLLPNMPANVCIRATVPPFIDIDDCNFSLRTRTGAQTLYALIAMLDINALASGNAGPGDFQIVGYATLGGLDPAEDDSLVDMNLQMVDESTLVDTTIAAGALPGSLARTIRGATIDLGSPGFVVLPPPEMVALLPTLDIEEATLPDATEDFDGSYTFFGTAFEAGTAPYPVSRLVQRDSAPGDVDLGDWLAPPADLMGDPIARAYSFTRTPGSVVHDVSIDDTDGTRAYNVLWLEPPVESADGGAPSDVISFTLPQLEVDPLPVGNLHMTVRATEAPGFDPREFTNLAATLDAASRLTEDRLRITQ